MLCISLQITYVFTDDRYHKCVTLDELFISFLYLKSTEICFDHIYIYLQINLLVLRLFTSFARRALEQIYYWAWFFWVLGWMSEIVNEFTPARLVVPAWGQLSMYFKLISPLLLFLLSGLFTCLQTGIQLKPLKKPHQISGALHLHSNFLLVGSPALANHSHPSLVSSSISEPGKFSQMFLSELW